MLEAPQQRWQSDIRSTYSRPDTKDRPDNAPSTVDNVIGRATIDYGLKEAYQPSNVVLDMMVFRLEAAATDGRRELIKLQADNAEESGLTGGTHSGLTGGQKN